MRATGEDMGSSLGKGFLSRESHAEAMGRADSFCFPFGTEVTSQGILRSQRLAKARKIGRDLCYALRNKQEPCPGDPQLLDRPLISPVAAWVIGATCGARTAASHSLLPLVLQEI